MLYPVTGQHTFEAISSKISTERDYMNGGATHLTFVCPREHRMIITGRTYLYMLTSNWLSLASGCY
jgi:hypothetical protein